jgi:iron complex transport system substrate-binding protein
MSSGAPTERTFVTNTATRRLAIIGLALVASLGLSSCAAGEVGPGAGDTRTFETEFGPVEVPVTIERIVSVDFYTPAALIDLGIEPVGVVNSYFQKESLGIPDTYREAIQNSDAISIGEYYEMNLEAVAEARPDVIVATDDFLTFEDPLRAELEKIAPIVTFAARDSLSWKSRADGMAELVGKQDELAKITKEYDARLAEVKQAHAGFLADETLAIVVAVDDEWGTYASTHFTGGVWTDLGAKYRDQQDDEVNEAKFPNWFSYEAIDRLNNATVLFSQRSLDELPAALNNNVIWDNLQAVKDGLLFDNILYSPTGSYGWAIINLDDIDALLTKVDAVRTTLGR